MCFQNQQGGGSVPPAPSRFRALVTLWLAAFVIACLALAAAVVLA